MKRVLGLDLGTNSLGWAILDVPESDSESGAVVALGSRVFPEGAEESGSKAATKCAERRQQRSMRRQIARRAKRRTVLRDQFAGLGLLPTDADAYAQLMDQNPNLLLKKGNDGKQLTLGEIGRVIYWFSSRRGFLSLRSGGSNILSDDEDDESFKPVRFRQRQFSETTREEVETGQEDSLVEFLKTQEQYYPDLIDHKFIFGRRGRLEYPVKPIAQDEFLSGADSSVFDEFGVHGLVFFQRKVYWRKKTIGKCSIDPGSGNRAARAERLSQRFVLWQTLAHLRVGREKRVLTRPERDLLYQILNKQKTLAFSKVRKELSLDKDEAINFERPEIKSLQGNQTEYSMHQCLGETWESFTEDQRNQVVFLLLGESTDTQMRQALAAQFGLVAEQIDALLKKALPPGRMNFSRKTLARILEFLPDAESVHAATVEAKFIEVDTTFDLHSVTNPFVKASLSQVTKVLNSLTQHFERSDGSTFDVIRVELTRDVSNSVKIRKEIEKKQSANRKVRDEAKERIAQLAPGAENSRDSIRRMQLWHEQGGECLYTGKRISEADALSNKFQLDHILPRSQTMNDSLGNIVLVATSANADKGEHTIFEWGGEDKVNEVVARARKMKLRRAKINNIESDHVADDAIPSSLLVQTGYINSLARQCIEKDFGIQPEVSRGRLTAHLRYRIGVDKDSNDHRRHGLDAAMVALTDIRTAQKLAKEYKAHRDRDKEREEAYGDWEPWEGFRADLMSKYEEVIVSHRSARKVSGQLHEETYYGKVNSPNSTKDSMYARRRPVSGGFASKKQLDEVADSAVKKALIENLRSRGQDPDKAGKFTFDPKDPPVMPDGTEIKKVRCHMNLPSNIILRPESAPKTGVTLGNNYGAYVYINSETEKWRVDIVPRLCAHINRGKSQSELRKLYAQESEEFKFSLTIGEVLCLTDPSSEQSDYFVVFKMSGDAKTVSVRKVSDSSKDIEKQKHMSADKLAEWAASKVAILPDGTVRRAND